jgi:predicted dehydrogenase
MDAIHRKVPVFCEKPLAHIGSVHFKKVDMVGYNLRFHGCVKAAKVWIDNGDIGVPMWANFTCGQYNEKYAKAGSGVIFNWSHEIDLAFHLLGSGATVSAAAAHTREGVDFIADISLRHDSKCLSSVHLDYVSRPEVRQFIVCGDKGQVLVDLLNRHAWLRDADGEIVDRYVDEKSFDDDYIEEIKAFMDGRYDEGCTGEEGLLVLNACLAAKGIAA